MMRNVPTIDSELYKTIITIIDERVKEIRVTRKDFNDLKNKEDLWSSKSATDW
ncbi:MAG: hypothetical protein HWN68_01940 [Desulfobacterales bacterium]|nr:hypothetical protein [Desulfobacterales bacterium]